MSDSVECAPCLSRTVMIPSVVRQHLHEAGSLVEEIEKWTSKELNRRLVAAAVAVRRVPAAVEMVFAAVDHPAPATIASVPPGAGVPRLRNSFATTGAWGKCLMLPLFRAPQCGV
jgi:hypothetical protein